MPVTDPERLALIRSLRTQGATYQAIASQLDPPVTRERVRQICAEHGIAAPVAMRPCAQCGVMVQAAPNKRTGPVYCSKACRWQARLKRVEEQRRKRGVKPKAEHLTALASRRKNLLDVVIPLHESGLTYTQIAEQLGMHPPSLIVFMARHAPLGVGYRTWRKERGLPVPQNNPNKRRT
jgi:transposase-like protein